MRPRSRSVSTNSILLLGVLLGTPALAMDIELVTITAGPVRHDGSFAEYSLNFSVEGSGYDGGTVSRGGSPLCTLSPGGQGLLGTEEWFCLSRPWTSLTDACLNVGFGDFTIEVTASGAVADTLTLPFDPCGGSCSCNDAFAEYAGIDSPIDGMDIPPIPEDQALCWECSTPAGCGDGDYFVALKDVGQLVVASDLVRGVSGPQCWNPEICLSSGYFSSSALEIATDLAPLQTAAGDPFMYSAGFEAFNTVSFTVNTPPPTTPPGVPDGRAATSPMRVGKLGPGGSNLTLSWDAESCCAVTDHHIVWAPGAGLPTMPGGTYALGGAECNVGPDGTHDWMNVPDPVADLADPRGLLWWLVLAHDGAGLEGSWGHGAGGERNGPGPGGSSMLCNGSGKSLLNPCGR